MEFSELTGFPRILRRMDSDRRALRTRTLAKAAEIVGGTEALRRRFSVSALVLGVWLSGTEPLPTDVFLKAVDIVEEEVIASIKNRVPPSK